MVLMKLLLFTLSIVPLDAIICPKGQRVTRSSRNEICKECPDGFYQPTENDSQMCQPCTMCEENRGSVVIQKCTKETDTKCRCHGDFVPWADDSSTCKCDIGFGYDQINEACSKCKDGYFSDHINSPCQKWKACKSGEKIPGTKTSNVICNETKSNPGITTPYITDVTLQHTPEETHPLNIHTTTTLSPSGHSVTTEQNEKKTFFPSPIKNVIAISMFGVVAMLLLTAVTCRVNITSCVQRNPAVQAKDSLYRRPVEESGDGSPTSRKLYPVEP